MVVSCFIVYGWLLAVLLFTGGCDLFYCFRVAVNCFIVSGWLLAVLLFQGKC